MIRRAFDRLAFVKVSDRIVAVDRGAQEALVDRVFRGLRRDGRGERDADERGEKWCEQSSHGVISCQSEVEGATRPPSLNSQVSEHRA